MATETSSPIAADPLPAPTTISVPPPQKQLKGIGGWLLFFVVGLIVIGPLFGFLRQATEIHLSELGFPEVKEMADWQNYKTLLWICFTICCSLSVHGGVRLIRDRTWPAVAWAKTCLWIIGPGFSIVSSVIAPLLTIGAHGIDAVGSLGALIGSCIGAWIWSAYLNKSKRVAATYERRIVPEKTPPITDETEENRGIDHCDHGNQNDKPSVMNRFLHVLVLAGVVVYLIVAIIS